MVLICLWFLSFFIDTGHVYCWGSNQYGQCGRHTKAAEKNMHFSSPQIIGQALTEVLISELKSGWSHLLAVSGEIQLQRVFL